MYASLLWWILRWYAIVNALLSLESGIHTEAVRLEQNKVNTTYGFVRGKTIDLPTGKQIVHFLGIPYGNAERFEPPKAPRFWNVTFDATKYGKSCPQLENIPPFNLKLQDTSEECLNLNVFVPNTTSFREQSPTIPVLVWLHGGAFLLGTSASTDPSTLATEGSIIVVTINYRLGALGFLSLKEEGLAGNYALWDVIEALRWVQNNIQSFGGNPKNVTLGGWSAGARLVGVLMMSPYANGLYEKVLMMSGHAGGLYSYLEQDEADHRARYFGGLLRCPHPSSDFKNCLKRKSPAELIEAQKKTHPSALLAPWAPVVDGDFLPDSPPKLLDQGRFNGSSVLTGIANDDGSAFLNNTAGMNRGVDVSKGMTREAFEQAIGNKTWIRKQDNKVPSIIAFQYTDWTKPNDVNMTRRQYLDLLTDAIYRAPAIQSANAFAKKIPVYFYQVEYRSNDDPTPKWMGVTHRADLKYIFPKPTESTVSGFTQTMIEQWYSFVKSGIPNLPTDPARWPRYTISDQRYQILQGFPAPAAKLRIQKMKFWNEFLPKNGRAEETPPPPTASPLDDSDDLTVALIVVSFFLGFFFILVIIFIIIIHGRKTESPPPPRSTSNQTSYKSQSKEPVTPKEEPKYYSTPHTPSLPHESPGPYYGNSFILAEKKDRYPPPSPTYKDKYYDRKIDIVKERSSPSKTYMDSDML